MALSSQQRCVFVGNIPYDATEEQLIDICREVGPVVSFRLVIDRETGKPKGYGFCEYKDEETALSARRNLNGYQINGRHLRVDFAENDKNADRNREQGRGGPGLANVDPQRQIGGPAVLGESAQHQPIGLHIAITAATVMAGALGSLQTGTQSNMTGLQSQPALASDPLTLHLARMSRSQLSDIIFELKVMATQNRELARQLLLARPQLSKAVFQAQIMLGMVTPQVLQMQNIRQPPGQRAVRPLQDTQHAQQPAFELLPGLPPLSQRIETSLVPKLHDGQFTSVSQSSLVQNQISGPPQLMQPRSQIPQHSSSHFPRQAVLPGQSGVPPIHPIHASVRPLNQGANFLSLNQQIPSSLLQQSGQKVGNSNFGRSSQMALPKVATDSSVFPRPLPSDAAFQRGPLISSGISDPVGRDGDISTQAPDDTAPIHRNNAYLNRQLHITSDSKETVSRPSKIPKLDDRQSMPFSSSALKSSTSGPSQAFTANSVPANPQTNPVELQTSEKQAPQSQLPPEVETTLLQQVLKLTPEQLNSLPPEQQQQVIQLQQALRQQDQVLPA